ncbi:MAG: 3-dehydroquinate synthase [Armatimonadota bacterium]
MRRVTVAVPGRSYPILIGAGALETLGEQVREVGITGALALVQDAAVAPLYGARAAESLRRAGYAVMEVVVPSGEASKSLAQLGELYREFAGARLDRRAAVVALGGGVVGDLAGFAAASYLRGIELVQVPTTLLSQVDSSVGGKTGIDLPEGKNLVGAFHQPALVVADLATLETLPEREYVAGLAEIVKYGVIADSQLFRYLEENREAISGHYSHSLEHLVERSCQIKAEVVGQDERESGLREILNYGHTVGHAVEAVAGYGRYAHGEAVAIGMVAAGRLSRARGWLAPGDEQRIRVLLEAFGLPVGLHEPLPREALLAAMRLDKKTRGSELRFVLARGIGRVETAAVPEAEVTTALDAIWPE